LLIKSAGGSLLQETCEKKRTLGKSHIEEQGPWTAPDPPGRELRGEPGRSFPDIPRVVPPSPPLPRDPFLLLWRAGWCVFLLYQNIKFMSNLCSGHYDIIHLKRIKKRGNENGSRSIVLLIKNLTPPSISPSSLRRRRIRRRWN